jgi:hypothetical protein
VVNRVHPTRGSCTDVARDELLERLYARREVQAIPRDSLRSLLNKMCRNLAEAEQLAASDRREIARLRSAAGAGHIYIEVPRFHHDIYDLEGLAEIGGHLFEDSVPAAADRRSG